MQRRPQLAIVVAIVCVSFASIFIRWSESPALSIAFYRLAFATLLLAPFLATAKGAQIRTLNRRDLGLLAAVGFALAVHFATWILSLEYVDVATSVVLVTSHPLLVAVVSHFRFKERVTRRMAVGIGVGFGGVVLIALVKTGQGPNPLLGSFLAYVGCVAVAAYLLAGRRIRQRIDVLPYATTVYAFSTAFLLVFSLATAKPFAIGGDLPREILLFLLLAAVSQIGGHTVYNWTLKHVSATTVSASLLMEPVGASILAFLLLGEVPGCMGASACTATGPVLLGSALVLAGVYLTARESFRPPPASRG